MDIGEPQRTIVIEPLVTPVPEPEKQPARPVPEREKEKVPA